MANAYAISEISPLARDKSQPPPCFQRYGQRENTQVHKHVQRKGSSRHLLHYSHSCLATDRCPNTKSPSHVAIYHCPSATVPSPCPMQCAVPTRPCPAQAPSHLPSAALLSFPFFNEAVHTGNGEGFSNTFINQQVASLINQSHFWNFPNEP